MQICSEDLNIPDRGFQKLHIIAKSFDMDLSILRPVQNSRINMIALTCKTDILRSKVLIIGIRVRSLSDHFIDQRKVFFFFHLFVLFTSFIYIVWMSLCYHQTFWLYMPNNSQIKRFVFIQNIQQKKDLDDIFVSTSSKSFLFYIIFSSITFSIRLFTSSASSVVCISLYSS